jgi:hypothetical protein
MTGKGFLVGDGCTVCKDSTWETASVNIPSTTPARSHVALDLAGTVPGGVLPRQLVERAERTFQASARAVVGTPTRSNSTDAIDSSRSI